METLCAGLPQEFAEYMLYCRNLKFDERPDYLYLARLFKDLSIKLEYHNDHLFDWTMLRYTKAMVEKQRDLLLDTPQDNTNNDNNNSSNINNANNSSNNNGKGDSFNKVKLLAMKKFATHFHYCKNEDKHHPTPEEIKQQSVQNSNAAALLPEELLNAIDKGMESLKNQHATAPAPAPAQAAVAGTAAGGGITTPVGAAPEPLLQQQQKESQYQPQQVPQRMTHYPPQTQPAQSKQDKPRGEDIWL